MILSPIYCDSDIRNKDKPYIVLPVPLGFPNRNDRAEQCFVRIEDVDIIETVSTYCDTAHEFLKEHIAEYNVMKQAADGIKVSSWGDDNPVSSTIKPVYEDFSNVKHWKLSTILDPITHLRIYVSQKADCRLIIYSLDGMSNYNVNCEKILSYVNESANSANICDALTSVTVICLYLMIILW